MSESLISTLGVGSIRKGPKEGLTALVHIDDSMKALMSQAQPDSIDAKEELSAEMTKLMIAKIDDFKMTTNRIQSVLKDDIIKKIVFKNCDNLFCVDLKKSKNSKPVIFMGYYNMIFQYGENEFLRKCKISGVNGLIC